MADPTGFTTGKELVQRDRLFRGEEHGVGDHAEGVFLELWEDRNGRKKWALAILDDYRAHLGEGIHVPLDDDQAGWLQRHYVAGGDGDD